MSRPLTRSVRDRAVLIVWAVQCAERVLPLFEAERAADDRPQLALDVARGWRAGRFTTEDARAAAFEAHAAARAAVTSPAIAAARSCGHAVAVAHMAGHAAKAAMYAAKATAEANPGTPSAAGREDLWQRSTVPEALRSFVYPHRR